MQAFQSADDKVTFSHVLEVIDEQSIDYCPAESADERYCLCGRLFRHCYGEAGGNLRYESNYRRRPLIGKAFFGEMGRGI